MSRAARLVALILGILGLSTAAAAQFDIQSTSSSPSNAVSLSSTTCTGTPGTGTGCAVLNVSAYGAASIQATGTWVGTLSFFVSGNGVDYRALNVTASNGAVSVTTATTNAMWFGVVGGAKYLKVAFTAYTSGTAVVTLQAALSGGAGGGGGGGGGGGAVTMTDGANVAQGSTTDTVVTGDADGTLISHVRYLDKAFADLWDTTNHVLKTSVAGGGSAVSISDGSDVTQGAKADAKSTATDTTAVTLMSVFKEISFMEQNPATRAVTAISGGFVDGALVTLGAKTDAKSTATDGTSITAMQVLKEISAVTQVPPQTFADSATFTAASSRYTPTGGVYQSVITNLTDGQAGAFAVTSTRDLHIATYDGSGNALSGQRVSTTSLPVTLPGTSNTLQSAVTASGNGTVLTVTGYSSAVLTVNCATCSGGTTINFEASEDSTNFTSVFGVQVGTSTIASSTTASGIAVWQFPVSGFVQFRARVSAYSAGTVTVTAHAQGVTYDPKVINANLVAGSAVIGHVIADSGSTTAVTGTVSVAGTGTAGSAAGGVLTVQGVASMTKLLVTPDLPALAATSTKQSDGTQKTQIVDGSGNVIASTTNALNVQCANCSGSGVSTADEAAFTAGSSSFVGMGGFFQTTATNNALTTGQQGFAQMTATRALFTNLRNAAGTEVGTSTTPLQVTLANTGANATAVKVDGSAVTQPVGGTVASGATDSGNPVKVGGIYNSSPITLTNGQRGDVQLDANGYTKVNIVAGSAANAAASATGSAVPASADYVGVNVAGTLRGQTAVNPSGTVYAAQTDLTSVAGTTLVTGTGAQGAGSPRVTVATDTATVAGSTVALMGVSATGAAVPANAVYQGAQDASGNNTGDIVCTSSKIYDASTSGNTELVAISGSKHVYVCGYEMFAAGTVNLSLVAGTGTACASAASGATSTGTSGASAALTPAWQFTTQTGKVSAYPSHGWLLDAGSANALCLKTSAGVAAQVQVFYSQR